MKNLASSVHKQFDLSGKNIVVTGAGYGLGREMAIGLGAAGANVMIASRTDTYLMETMALIEKEGAKANYFAFDATDRESCGELINATMKSFGRLDVMVINHGIIAVDTPEKTSERDWNNVISTNLTSCFYCAQAAGKQMIKQREGGSIIMTSSNGSMVGFDGLSAYGASKGGVDQLCRQLSSEWGKYNIRVNTINPGYTKNPMSGRPTSTVTQEMEQEIKNKTPLQRRGELHEFVGPVIFLASEASSFVSGHTLTVDGGYCAR